MSDGYVTQEERTAGPEPSELKREPVSGRFTRHSGETKHTVSPRTESNISSKVKRTLLIEIKLAG